MSPLDPSKLQHVPFLPASLSCCSNVLNLRILPCPLLLTILPAGWTSSSSQPPQYLDHPTFLQIFLSNQTRDITACLFPQCFPTINSSGTTSSFHLANKQSLTIHPAGWTTSSPQPNQSFESYLIRTCWALPLFLAQSYLPNPPCPILLAQSFSKSGQPANPHPPPSSLSNIHIHPNGIFVLSPNHSPSSSSMPPST